MFKNYFKSALRNIRRNKGFAFINMAGLAIGMAAVILILLWVQNRSLLLTINLLINDKIKRVHMSFICRMMLAGHFFPLR